MPRTFQKVLILIGSVLILLIVFYTCILWLLTSKTAANASLAIGIKNYYYLNFAPKLKITYLDYPFSIFPVSKIESPQGISYAYIVNGSFEDIDPKNQILYLKTKDSIVYGFKYNTVLGTSLFYKEKLNGTFQNTSFREFPLTRQDIISVQWTDKRTLYRIFQDADLDDNKLLNPNMNADDFYTIVHR